MGAVPLRKRIMFSACKQIRAGESDLQDRADFFSIGSNLILIIADGAGGMSGGAEAAEFTVEALKKKINVNSLTSQGIANVLLSIDEEMARIGAYGETTCVVAAVSESGVIGASVGDSGAWLISEAGADNLTAHQQLKPFLGSGRATPVGFSRNQFQGTLLVASDGLLKYASIERIAAVAITLDLDQASRDLIELVRYPSGALPDDTSVVLARAS